MQTIISNHDKYYAQPTNIYQKMQSHEKVFTKDINGDHNRYNTQKTLNMAQKALELGKPKNQPSQMSEGYVQGMRSFDVYDSKMSADKLSMRKAIHQQILNEALLSKAAMIRSNHEKK